MEVPPVPLLRYVMDLALRAAIGILGLCALAYAGFNMVLSTPILARMAEAGEGAPPWFLAQHYGFHLLIAAGGIGLIVVSVRGLIGRIRMGLPTEQEGVGKTTASQLGSIVIYGAALCFGLYSIGVSIVPAVQMSWLVLNGVTTEATIIGFAPTDDPKHWIVKYKFTTANGRVITDTTFEDGYETPSTEIMSHFKVTYVAADPAEHDVTEYHSFSGLVLFMVLRLAIVLVGVWGVAKNFGAMLGRRGPPPQQDAPEPPSRPLPSVPLRPPVSARAAFGRRGA
jgi:hypothetical protein